jgi:3-deoxy-D-manno-octulosonic-acid transferase
MSLGSDMIYGAVGLLTSPVWGYRLLRTGKWRTDWRGRLGHVQVDEAAPGPGSDGRRVVMIHAVSVGEVNAVRLLVEQLEREAGESVRIVISTTTDTGTARAKALFEPRHRVVRYPLDFTASVRRFLDAVRPDVVALTELEVWPTFAAECVKRKIPLAVINGRLSARSFGRYKLIRPVIRGAFGSLAAAAVQDEAYAERFVAMGAAADRVVVTGTMKWDTAQIVDEVAGSTELAAEMGIDRGRPLVVCGSTGPGEEAMLAEAMAGLDVQLMFAPRKPERFDEAAAALGPGVVRRTQNRSGAQRAVDGAKLFLLDTIGELRRGYALADVVVVGRSFCPLYGSDMIEPIGLGMPTVIGPNVADFRDQMDRLLAGDGIVQVDGAAGVKRAVATLLDPAVGRALAERGRAVIRAQQGATARHAALIRRLLGDDV